MWQMFALFVTPIIGLLIGVYLGTRTERTQWTRKANSVEYDSNTAYYADGRWYYIFEESYFIRNYRRKEVIDNGTQSSTS